MFNNFLNNFCYRMQGKILRFFTLSVLFGLIKSQADNPNVDVITAEATPLLEDQTEFFVDNRIDQIPTYVPPAERFLKKLARSLEILSRPSDPTKNSTGVEKIIFGITKPITGILKPVGKTLGRGISSTGFGDILNLFKDHFRAVYPGAFFYFKNLNLNPKNLKY